MRAVDTADDPAFTDCVSGDPEAFNRLVERHASACLALARQVLLDEGKAQVAVQDAFLELWRNANLFDPRRSTLGSFLVTLTHRRAIDTLRQDKIRARPDDQITGLASDYNLEEHAMAGILGQPTVELLGALPAGQRQCLMLAYWGGYSMSEIAQHLDVPVGTVKTRCRAALEILRVLVHERGTGPMSPARAGGARGGVNDYHQALTNDQADHAPAARDNQAGQRDLSAGVRDDEAGERNMQADLRDVAAARRDAVADQYLATFTTAEQLRDLCLVSRQSAQADRCRAAADRHAEAEERYAAERDRNEAAVDRQASAKERLEASIDPLTGAHTRAEGFKNLSVKVGDARREQQSLILAFLDVDGLKEINDANGHEAGDQALICVVGALRTHLRDHDLIMRFGGDEFLCALTSVSQAEVEEYIERVKRSLAHGPAQVTITVGLATLGPDETIDELFRRADSAFYDTRKRR